jgi:sterol desaturase/sphingolipid hydroxylase (fatty acid hydroxylase superfamily)
VLNYIAVRIVVLITAFGAALDAEHRASGLLNRIPLPGGIALVIAVIALDLAIYLQHRVFHAVPLLWRSPDASHGPLLRRNYRSAISSVEGLHLFAHKDRVVLAIGASVRAVLAFAVLLNATSLFNHGRVGISVATDRWLRWLLVPRHASGPSFHRASGNNGNFGFNLS